MNFDQRPNEVKYLNEKLRSRSAELILVYGRRRVGKTALVRHVAGEFNGSFLEITGVKGLPVKRQILNSFANLGALFSLPSDQPVPDSWDGYFKLATEQFKKSDGEILFFIDEFPWFCSPRSNFLHYFDYYWNTQWCRLPRLKIIVCGSATSWLLENILGDKGGLHNRITGRLNLQPFDVAGANKFLRAHGIVCTPRQLIELYLCFGGVPYYLNWITRPDSPATIINQLLNEQGSVLVSEYEILLQALFRNTKDHKVLIEAIHAQQYGVPRTELASTAKISDGAHFANLLSELVACGFAHKYIPFGLKERFAYYRLTDEYLRFYLRWLQGRVLQNIAAKKDFWFSVMNTAEYYTWAGYGFETVCQKEANALTYAMGISGMQVDISNYRDKITGHQIDLVFDRADDVINLFEIKFSKAPFSIDAHFMSQIAKKDAAFKAATKTRKSVRWVLVASDGIVPGANSDYFQNILTVKDLIHGDG